MSGLVSGSEGVANDEVEYLRDRWDGELVVEAGLAEEEVGVGGAFVGREDVVGGVDVAGNKSVHGESGYVVMEVGWRRGDSSEVSGSLEGR